MPIIYVRVITKSDDRAAWADLFITSIITDRTGRQEILLQINQKNYCFWEKNNSQVMNGRGKFALRDWQRRSKLLFLQKGRYCSKWMWLAYSLKNRAHWKTSHGKMQISQKRKREHAYLHAGLSTGLSIVRHNNLTRVLDENRSFFKPITREEIVIFIINALIECYNSFNILKPPFRYMLCLQITFNSGLAVIWKTSFSPILLLRRQFLS